MIEELLLSPITPMVGSGLGVAGIGALLRGAVPHTRTAAERHGVTPYEDLAAMDDDDDDAEVS